MFEFGKGISFLKAQESSFIIVNDPLPIYFKPIIFR